MESKPTFIPRSPSPSRVRAARYKPKKQLIVASKTLGTTLTYELTTENVSRSGMLLSWDQSMPIPFIESTILEMTIDPEGTWLDGPVTCLGKIVRKTTSDGAGVNTDVAFGINIVQIDEGDLVSWENCVAQISARSVPMSEKRGRGSRVA